MTPSELFWFQNSIFHFSILSKCTEFYSRCYFWQKCKKIIKSHVPETGIPPQRWRKTWKWCQFLLIFECHDCSVSFRSIRRSFCKWGHVRSRELSRYFWPYFTWLTSDSIFKMFNFCIFEKNSAKTKLKNYKTELNSLRRGLIRSRTFENTQHRSFLFRDLFQKF